MTDSYQGTASQAAAKLWNLRRGVEERRFSAA